MSGFSVRFESNIKSVLSEMKPDTLDVKEGVFQLLKWWSEQLAFAIKEECPKDTGRSAAGWGVYTAQHLQSAPYRTLTASEMAKWIKRRSDSSDKDCIWLEKRAGGQMSITQGIRDPVMAYLEAGHSRQAPAGFIDRLTETYGARFADELQRTIGDWIQGKKPIPKRETRK